MANLALPLAEGFAQIQASPGGHSLEIDASLYGPIVDCMGVTVRGRLARIFKEYGSISNIGFMYQFLSDMYQEPADLFYTYTKVGGVWRGKLLLDSNADEVFEGIPGSITSIPGNILDTDNPSFSLKERPFVVRRASGTVVYESAPINYTADPTVDGYILRADVPDAGRLYR